MSIQEEPRRQIVLLCIRLSGNKSAGYSYDSLFQTTLTFEESDREANSAECCFV